MNGRGLGVRSHSRLSIGTKEPVKTTLGFMARKIQQVGAKGQQDCQSGMEEAWVPNAVGFGARPQPAVDDMASQRPHPSGLQGAE